MAAVALYPYLNGYTMAVVAGIMVIISLDELIPVAKSFGSEHMPIFGVLTGMAVMALSLWMLKWRFRTRGSCEALPGALRGFPASDPRPVVRPGQRASTTGFLHNRPSLRARDCVVINFCHFSLQYIEYKINNSKYIVGDAANFLITTQSPQREISRREQPPHHSHIRTNRSGKYVSAPCAGVNKAL